MKSPPNNVVERAVLHRGRTVLAMDFVLTGAGRPLDGSVSVHESRLP
jgi:hypothetical protein